MFRDRILKYSIVASIVINLFIAFWVSHSDLFQQADIIRDLRAREIKVYRPPVAVKPKPKPKPKPPPKQKPLPVTKPTPVQPPRPAQQRPQPARPAPPAPVNTGSHSTHGTIVSGPPEGQTGTQSNRAEGPPAPPAPAPPAPVPPAPAPPSPAPPPAPPAPAPPAPKPEPPPPPPPPAKPKHADQAQARPLGGWPDANLPDSIDVSSLKNTHVVVEIDVGVDGRPKSVRVVKGTGDGSADDYFKNLVRGMRFSPAYSNGEPLENTISYSWDIGN